MTAQERVVFRDDIECPGDTIPYNCSIMSNSEYVHLVWLVTLPGQMQRNITFDGSSSLNSANNLDMNITATLTNYIPEDYIESVIVLTVLSGVTVNGTEIECRSADLDSTTAIVDVNISGML